MSAVLSGAGVMGLSFGAEPIVLVGEPRHCVGVLHLHNPQPVPVRLRRVALHARDALAKLCTPGQPLALVAPVAVGEGETVLRRVSLRLPPHTPPGQYAAEVQDAAGHTHPVTIHVLERRDTRLSPGSITHGAQPGDTITVTTVVSNHGNVTLEIPTRAVLDLHDAEVGWPHHFHSAAKSHGEAGYSAFLDAFVKKLGQAEPPLGRVKVTVGAGPLPPGASRALCLDVSVPKSLRAGRAYRAHVRLGAARLSMKLHIEGDDHEDAAVQAG